MTNTGGSRTGWLARLTSQLALLALLVAPLAVAQGDDELLEDQVSFEVTMHRVDLYRNGAGETVERFTEVTEAISGQEIEYRITATNDGDRIYRAREFVATVDLPEGSEYVEGSAASDEDDFTVRYSSDGGEEFSEEPPASLADLTSIEWVYLERFEPGDEITMHYRVTVL